MSLREIIKQIGIIEFRYRARSVDQDYLTFVTIFQEIFFTAADAEEPARRSALFKKF